MVKIKTISIKAIRGIPDLTLDFDGQDVLIKGDNGTGKSSILDAIEFFFSGKISIFEGAGTGSLSTKRNLCHHRFELSDSEVTVTFRPGNISLNRKYDVFSEIPSELSEYFMGAQKSKFILHRSEMLKYIVSRPADRFKAISSILGTEDLDDIELQLRQLYNDLQGRVREKKGRIRKNFQDISEVLEAEVSNLSEILPVLNDKRSSFGLDPLESLSDLEQPLQNLVPLVRDIDNIESLQEFVTLKEKISEEIIEDLGDDLEDINKRAEPLIERKYNQKLFERTSFMRQGVTYLSESEENICPFCGQEVNREELLEEINSRLSVLIGLSEEASELREIIGGINEKFRRSISNINSIIENSSSYEEFSNFSESLSEIKKDIEGLMGQLKKTETLEELITISDYKTIFSDSESITLKFNKILELKISEIISPERSEDLLNLIEIISSIKIKINEINELNESLNEDNPVYNVSEKIYNIFKDNKDEKIEQIYTDIVKDVNLYYSILHDDDPHRDINLLLTRGRSVDLKMDIFEIEQTDPRGYISEGHLDSLGLCIFLAFVKKFNEGCTLLILDDVVTTIDQGHREFIGKLLSEQFQEFQILITTHDAIWFSQLQKYGRYKVYTIDRWTEEDGPFIRQHIPTWEIIEQKLDNGDKPGAGSDARRYLEWVLKTLVKNTLTKVVMKPDGLHTVGDLYYDLKARMNKLIADETERDEIINAFEELERRTFMANLLAHDNPQAELLSLEEVQRFCKSVEKLKSKISCNECGSLLKYPPDIKRLICSNRRCRNPRLLVCR